MSTANPQTGSGSLSDRINALSQKLSKQEAAISRSTTVMAVVGVVALTLLTAYFYFGYGEIAKLLEPSTLVPYGATMIENNLPEARQRLVQVVNDSAPAWAEQVSQNLRQSIPTARGKLEDYILSQTDDLMVQTTKITEEKFRTTIQENRELIESGFNELANSEELSDVTLEALVAALDEQLSSDLREQAEGVLDTLQHLRSRVQKLVAGVGLDEEEQSERRILMLARRLQVMEADPTPIHMPDYKPAVTTVTEKSSEEPVEEASTKDAASADAKPSADKPADATSTERNKPTEGSKPDAPAKPAEKPSTDNPADVNPAKPNSDQ